MSLLRLSYFGFDPGPFCRTGEVTWIFFNHQIKFIVFWRPAVANISTKLCAADSGSVSAALSSRFLMFLWTLIWVHRMLRFVYHLFALYLWLASPNWILTTISIHSWNGIQFCCLFLFTSTFSLSILLVCIFLCSSHGYFYIVPTIWHSN